MSNNAIKKVGEINILKIELISYNGTRANIASLVGNLTLYQDMYTPTMSGTLFINDSSNMINTFPIIGQELVEISFKTPSLDKAVRTQVFYIYKMTDRTYLNASSQSYTLHFISKEAIISTNKRISRSYSGKISETVKKLYAELSTKKKISIEETVNNYKFITPYWTPLESINWVTPRAISPNKGVNYVFFETFDAYNFASLSTLFQEKPIRTYEYSSSNLSSQKDDIENKEKAYSIIEEIYTNVTFDYIRSLSMGMYSSILNTLDLTTKVVNTQTYTYTEDFKTTPHLEKFPMVTDNIVAKKAASLNFIEKNDYLFSGKVDNQRHTDWFLKRNSLMEQIFGIKLIIKVPGRSDIQVGQTVNVKLPINEQVGINDTGDKAIDKVYSGKYLITAVRHNIYDGKHELYLELSKDSFTKQLKSNN